MTNRIDREDARIIVEGPLSFTNLHYLLATIYGAINKAGYQDLVLDLSKCFFALPGAILAVCAQVIQLRQNGIYCGVRLPSDERLRRLFLNANWAHLLDPRGYDPSRFQGYSRLPATQFKGPEDQQTAVNRIADAILGAIPDMDRADFAAFEWAISELTDNVLTHSESQIGGLVQVRHSKGIKNVSNSLFQMPGSEYLRVFGTAIQTFRRTLKL